jgi:hypothetical protein
MRAPRWKRSTNQRSPSVTISDRTGAVTGGGRIVSPAGAYPRIPALTGDAAFGFVCSFVRGASTPEGVTEFRLPAAFLSLRSTSHLWLVVAGSTAMYEGIGSVNGVDGFGFLVTAEEGGRDGVDAFGIKIWNAATGALVYDDRPAALAPGGTTPLIGGSIAVSGE